MTDRLNYGPRDTGHLLRTTQYALKPNDMVLYGQENNDAGVVDLYVETPPEYSAAAYAFEAAHLKQELFVITAALEQSSFRNPATSNNVFTSPSQEPQPQTNWRRDKKNRFTSQPALNAAPNVTLKQQKAIARRIPRTREDHRLLVQLKNKRQTELLNLNKLQKAAGPSGIRTIYVDGEQGYRLNHTISTGLSLEDRVKNWHRFGYQNQPRPNRYRRLNEELRDVLNNDKPTPKKKAKIKAQPEPQPEPSSRRRQPKLPIKHALFALALGES